MKNYIAEGEVLTVVAGVGGITSGLPVVVGSLIGIAIISAAEGEKASVALEGVYEVAKANVAIAQGDKVYWDSTASKFTNVAAGNKFAGHAYEAAIQAATVVNLVLDCCGQSGQIANVAAEATVNGSDAATTQALANALKVKLNAVISALKASGLMIAD